MNGVYHLTLYLEKNKKVYSFCVPLNSPYDEASEVAKEFAQQVLDMQKQAVEAAEKAKLEQEAANAKQEAASDK